MDILTKLPETYDVDALLKVYESLPWQKNKHTQVMITSPDGNTYISESGSLKEWSEKYEEKDFCVMNTYFKGTYVEEVYNDLASKYNIIRCRFMVTNKLHRAYSLHTDPTPRIHVPLTTDDKCSFLIEGNFYYLNEIGRAYWMDTRKEHTALNLGYTKRIHIVGTIDE